MSPEIIRLIANATGETLYMVAVAARHRHAVRPAARRLPRHQPARASSSRRRGSTACSASIVNATRSTPFIILVVAIIPFTRLIAGTSIGTNAAIVPLTVAATPFIARLIEGAIREVDQGLIEAARAFGATPLQIVLQGAGPRGAARHRARPDARRRQSLLGFSAMVGAVGGGGLGDLGIRYGYQRFMPDVMAAVVVVLIVLVQAVQSIGDRLARRLNKRIRHA